MVLNSSQLTQTNYCWLYYDMAPIFMRELLSRALFKKRLSHPHFRPSVSCVLGIPAVPVSVLRSSIQRGEWVLAGVVSPRREHSSPSLSFCSTVFGVPRDTSLPPLSSFGLLCPWSTGCPCFSAEEFYPERRRWAGANARIPPTT